MAWGGSCHAKSLSAHMMTRSTLSSLLLFGVLAFAASACGKYALDTYWRSQNYRLIAKDTRGQMSLVDTSDQGWSGIGPAVFSIGADDTYIVVAQHPSTGQVGRVRTAPITRYFVVERNHTPASTSTVEGRSSPIGIRGPLTGKEEFGQALDHLIALPTFSKTFEDLK